MDVKTVHFFSEGIRLAADLYVPAGMRAAEKRPGIVVCHGFTGIRALILGDYAKAFCEAGLVAMTFDYRGFGDSEGEKHRLIPMEQIDDIRNAITYLQAQPQVDPERIGLWGTSFGGYHAPYVAGVDTRVKAAVGQVGGDDGERLLDDIRSWAQRQELRRKVAEDRVRRVVEGKGEKVDTTVFLANPDTIAFFESALKVFPHLKAELSWETAEKTLEYKPIDVVHKIAPRALCLIGAEHDELCLFEGYERLYARAGEPKKLVKLPIRHYEIYTGKWLEESARIATEFLVRHLM